MPYAPAPDRFVDPILAEYLGWLDVVGRQPDGTAMATIDPAGARRLAGAIRGLQSRARAAERDTGPTENKT
jgi:hypothetical protein